MQPQIDMHLDQAYTKYAYWSQNAETGRRMLIAIPRAMPNYEGVYDSMANIDMVNRMRSGSSFPIPRPTMVASQFPAVPVFPDNVYVDFPPMRRGYVAHRPRSSPDVVIIDKPKRDRSRMSRTTWRPYICEEALGSMSRMSLPGEISVISPATYVVEQGVQNVIFHNGERFPKCMMCNEHTCLTCSYCTMPLCTLCNHWPYATCPQCEALGKIPVHPRANGLPTARPMARHWPMCTHCQQHRTRYKCSGCGRPNCHSCEILTFCSTPGCVRGMPNRAEISPSDPPDAATYFSNPASGSQTYNENSTSGGNTAHQPTFDPDSWLGSNRPYPIADMMEQEAALAGSLAVVRDDDFGNAIGPPSPNPSETSYDRPMTMSPLGSGSGDTDDDETSS
jgi:hypothetical protein